MPIRSIIIKNNVTNRAERVDGVMFSNNLLFVFAVFAWVCKILASVLPEFGSNISTAFSFKLSSLGTSSMAILSSSLISDWKSLLEAMKELTSSLSSPDSLKRSLTFATSYCGLPSKP